MPDKETVLKQLKTPVLQMEFKTFHSLLEKVLDRTVLSSELSNPNKLIKELKNK